VIAEFSQVESCTGVVVYNESYIREWHWGVLTATRIIRSSIGQVVFGSFEGPSRTSASERSFNKVGCFYHDAVQEKKSVSRSERCEAQDNLLCHGLVKVSSSKVSSCQFRAD
jgi:hypothetical protein